MKQIIIISFAIILFNCHNEPERQKIMVNKTVKVFSTDYHDKAENYTFKWKSPIGPNKENIMFDLKNDMLIFTPKEIGNYEVSLTIEDISNEIVEKQSFYYTAIPETAEVAIIIPQIKEQTKQIIIEKEIEKDPNKNIKSKDVKKTTIKSKKKPKKKKERLARKKINDTQNKELETKKVEYILQISAWPSLEEAREHQLKLIGMGFDAYTQRYYLKDKDELWYRV